MAAQLVFADPSLREEVEGVAGIRCVYDASELPRTGEFILLSSASQLILLESTLEAANEQGRVRAYLVMLDTEPRWGLPAKWLATHGELPTLVHPQIEVLKRVISGWARGVPENLVATAVVADDRLHVRDCRLQEHSVAVKDIPALRALDPISLRHFEVSDSGSYIWWPRPDVHLGMDQIRYFADPAHRKAIDEKRQSYDRAYGSAIAQLRKARGLRQSDVPGLTDRQVRRIERGISSPREASLQHLAQAHGLGYAEYLAELADLYGRLSPPEKASQV